MKIVSYFRGVWKLTDKRYKELLTDVADGKTWNLDSYGKQIGQIDLNALDLDAALAKELLPTTMSWTEACKQTARIQTARIHAERLAAGKGIDARFLPKPA